MGRCCWEPPYRRGIHLVNGVGPLTEPERGLTLDRRAPPVRDKIVADDAPESVAREYKREQRKPKFHEDSPSLSNPFRPVSP